MPSVSRRYPTGRSPYAWPSGAVDDELRAPVVLMVSGGADSTALLVMAATSALDIDDGRGTARIARERLHVLHINHGLRGLDADEDEEFVRGLAAEYGIPCTVERLDVAALAAKTSDNVENAGREARYAAAARLANELSEQFGTPRAAARICTAHTADDRAETFFMNAIRGSGAPGLSSIPRRRNRIVRPLLDKTHDELCEYLRMRGIVWREDDTNRDTRYLRAYVRHELMPVVERRNPRVVASIASTCDILSDEDAYLGALASRLLHDLIRRQDGEIYHIQSTTFDAGMLDLTHPDAVAYIKEVLIGQNMLDLGISGWMADFGEYLPVDCVLHRGDPAMLHNVWPVLWAKINREAIEARGKESEVMFFTRSGYLGIQEYAPILWNGDQHTDTTKDYGMPCVMPASFSLGFSGVPMVHCDIGGFFSFAKMKRSKMR